MRFRYDECVIASPNKFIYIIWYDKLYLRKRHAKFFQNKKSTWTPFFQAWIESTEQTATEAEQSNLLKLSQFNQSQLLQSQLLPIISKFSQLNRPARRAE